MSPVRNDTSSEASAWATTAIILAIVVAALIVAYFAWWGPARDTTVVVPQQQPPQTATPGPPGPPGPPGQPGMPAPTTGGAGPEVERERSPQDAQERLPAARDQQRQNDKAAGHGQ